MNDNDKTMIEEFKSKISVDIAKHVKKIIVYGSRVRGDTTEDSDLDIVALVDEKHAEVVEYLEESAYQVVWNHDFNPIISLKIFTESEFNDAANRGFSFYGNVLKEGISV